MNEPDERQLFHKACPDTKLGCDELDSNQPKTSSNQKPNPENNDDRPQPPHSNVSILKTEANKHQSPNATKNVTKAVTQHEYEKAKKANR